MAEDNKTVEQDNKTGVLQTLLKYWKYVLGGAGIITVITKYQTLFDWIRKVDISHLSEPIIIGLGILALICLALTIYFIKKKTPKPNIAIGFIFITILSGGLITIQQGANYDKIVVVYDKSTPEYHPNKLQNVSSNLISDIDKLISSGDIDSRTVLVSTVNKPVMNWKKNLSKNEISVPILSIQEVIDDRNTDIIDISFSSFDKYLAKAISENSIPNQDIRIFYEEGYELEEKLLSSKLNLEKDNYLVNPIKYNSKSFSKLLEPTSIVVFLGSPSGFRTFENNSSNENYKLLLVPNWLRPNITPVSNEMTSNRICLTSSVFENVVNGDYESWDKITSATFSKWNNADELRNNILIAFVEENYAKSIKF